MLDKLEELTSNNAGDIIDNNDLIKGKEKEVIQMVSETFFESLQYLFVSKGINGIMTFLDNGPSGASSFTDITVSNLTEKLTLITNISHRASLQIASVIIPLLVSKFVIMTNDRNDTTFSLEKIIESFNPVIKAL